MNDKELKLLAHIEAQDKRIAAVSGLVEALEQVALCSGRCDSDSEHTDHVIARAALAAWRKNHG